MPTTTLILHIIGIFLAVYIYRHRYDWRYFALMLLFSNFVGALFYFLVIIEGPARHEFSQLRSLIQAIILLAFGFGLSKDGDK